MFAVEYWLFLYADKSITTKKSLYVFMIEINLKSVNYWFLKRILRFVVIVRFSVGLNSPRTFVSRGLCMIDKTATITLSAQNLCRNYGSYAAVDKVSLQLRRGEVLGLLGSNGAGKTTTMRMLTGNLAPSAGSIEICGIDLLDKPQQAKAHLGFLPEIPPLYQDMTVDEYLLFAARLHCVSKQTVQTVLGNVKQRCGLEDRGKHLIGNLSKGFQQRVGIAQAIIHSPDVIILDEPTVGLDPNQIREIRKLIRELGVSSSVILSTHILSEVESVCDRVQIMHQGNMVLDETLVGLQQQGTPLETVFTQLTHRDE